MGIALEYLEFLCEASSDGVASGEIVTLGRQKVYATRRGIRRINERFGTSLSTSRDIDGAYADGVLGSVFPGATVECIDNSDYEGASMVHDMNKPVDASLDGRFDVVIDGGTLEHIFNFPVAIANCMRMTKTGGRIFVFAPGNNMMGHGFYQFSPELFYGVFSEANGCVVERMRAVPFRYANTECGSAGRGYEVSDPKQVAGRVMLINERPTYLMVQARKVREDAGLTLAVPQQSDYVALWSQAGGSRPADGWLKKGVRGLLHRMPSSVREFVWNEYKRRLVYSFRNRRAYRKDSER